jgi:hypothetical protein
MENGKVYRPDYAWMWAKYEAIHGQCTYRSQSTVDCYFKPLSTCWDKQLSSPEDVLTPISEEQKLQLDPMIFPTTGAFDSCAIAARVKKSLQWVQGNVLHYIMRPNSRLKHQIDTSAKQIFELIEHEKGIFIGVHVRGSYGIEWRLY